MLVFDTVSYSYRSTAGEIAALRDVSFALEPGTVLAVLGANGSGKSTLVRLSNGLALPLLGTVTVDGARTTDGGATRAVRSSVGMVFQNPDDQIVATSVRDDVAFGPENLGLERSIIVGRVDEALAAVGLLGMEEREPHLLSGGQKQRLAIAGALAMRPSYLVLDEPTSMLDPAGRREVRDCVSRVRAQGTGVLIVTHDISEAMLADAVIVLDAGAVVFAGTPEDLLGNSGRLDEWGLEMPAIGVLADELRAAGLEVADPCASPVRVVDALCR